MGPMNMGSDLSANKNPDGSTSINQNKNIGNFYTVCDSKIV